MTFTDTTTRTAETSAPILEVLAGRWSPRSFDKTAEVSETVLTSALEAARWSASASNTQPWKFIVGRRGTPVFDLINKNLMVFNQAWTPNASVLIVNVAEVVDETGKARRWGMYDLGQAVASLTVQAHADGLHVHQMGGIEVEGLREAFDLGERWEPLTVTALGVLAPAENLPDEKTRAREVAPRERKPLSEIVVS
ncbi:nitroreductase family protein [Subtercola boreus]|uniref:Nitroreductase n=1 Tax=Subtercola boreus TaxID=120213 RepID=A0A3E0W9J0_9MICO|nr:nitroreductase family protein [Subtercola boreus]RFA18016.1 nitroreductase [Subtercola boreus]RFA18398.1 nitroreductase [Subtercola boreus]RFA24927.1 nitroreductase [Subtercola boreus]